MTDTVDNDRNTDQSEPDPTPPPLRASDADRHAIVLILQDAVAAGLLNPDEGSERIASAYAATHLRDLPALVADLPSSRPVGKPGRAPRPGKAPRPDNARSQSRTGRAADKVGRWARAAYLSFLTALRRFLGTSEGGSPKRSRLIIAVLVGVLLIAACGLALGAFLFDGPGGGGHGGFEREFVEH